MFLIVSFWDNIIYASYLYFIKWSLFGDENLLRFYLFNIVLGEKYPQQLVDIKTLGMDLDYKAKPKYVYSFCRSVNQ